jgi:hypothetical protein
LEFIWNLGIEICDFQMSSGKYCCLLGGSYFVMISIFQIDYVHANGHVALGRFTIPIQSTLCNIPWFIMTDIVDSYTARVENADCKFTAWFRQAVIDLKTVIYAVTIG